MKSFSIVGRRYSASSSRRFSPFFSDCFERRGLVYVGADYSNLDITDESYQYDLNGNRELVTNANGDLVVYSTGTNNELNSDGNYSYAYDAEGNRISKTNAAGTERELYEWDYRNRLSSVTKQTFDSVSETWQTVQIVEYAYDYNNVLIRKVLDADGDGISDSKTIFLPENYQTAIQLDDADLSDSTYETVSHRYLWTPGQQDKLLADVTPTETLWTLTDHLGTVRDIIQNTPSGLVVPAHVIYDAYGNVLSCKDANGTVVSNPVLFGFTGKYFDADTQLQNNVNRWYDATVGRWLSVDPIDFNGNDTNLYRYVGNKSLIIIDFLGLKPILWTSLLPFRNSSYQCGIIIFLGHGTLEYKHDIINWGSKNKPFFISVPHDFGQFKKDLEAAKVWKKTNVFIGFSGCWANKFNNPNDPNDPNAIPFSQRLIIGGHPLDFGNLGNEKIDPDGMEQELNMMIPYVYRFANQLVVSRKCKSVTIFIVGSNGTYSFNNKLFNNGERNINFVMLKGLTIK